METISLTIKPETFRKLESASADGRLHGPYEINPDGTYTISIMSSTMASMLRVAAALQINTMSPDAMISGLVDHFGAARQVH